MEEWSEKKSIEMLLKHTKENDTVRKIKWLILIKRENRVWIMLVCKQARDGINYIESRNVLNFLIHGLF
jgi:hypothetical protein